VDFHAPALCTKIQGATGLHRGVEDATGQARGIQKMMHISSNDRENSTGRARGIFDLCKAHAPAKLSLDVESLLRFRHTLYYEYIRKES